MKIYDYELHNRLWLLPAQGVPRPIGYEPPERADVLALVGEDFDSLQLNFLGVPTLLLINARGLTLHLPRNDLATTLYRSFGTQVRLLDAMVGTRAMWPRPEDVIVGDVLLWFDA